MRHLSVKPGMRGGATPGWTVCSPTDSDAVETDAGLVETPGVTRELGAPPAPRSPSGRGCCHRQADPGREWHSASAFGPEASRVEVWTMGGEGVGSAGGPGGLGRCATPRLHRAPQQMDGRGRGSLARPPASRPGPWGAGRVTASARGCHDRFRCFWQRAGDWREARASCVAMNLSK